ncbi:hypothetical protein GUJ93_ZPchr0001g31570 [Zizania palustris]|uniref:Uncharacterized protein n=1 Tax=Zizania palustris TaxID=103762 RepID=A0A8J5RTC6_ZIZPA|nr:hypothetical protein GUJ93_ZPchr0001g31570 [Zizania palustris]
MGNMLPCLVNGRTTTLPAAMNSRQRIYSLKLLVKVLHKMKKKMTRSCSNKGNTQIGSSKSSSSPAPPSESASAAAAAAGGVVVDVVGRKPCSAKETPRRAAEGGGLRKGVVRLKVVLTKEQAAQLRSLTVAGGGRGRKTAGQIVAEIKRMEARGAAGVAVAAWRPALASIPEEDSSP